MEYPVTVDELKKYFYLHTGVELNEKIEAVLVAIVNLLNQAYDAGVKDGKKNM